MADTKLVKSAGEHWVCGVLSRLGWAAALTRDGVARTDILAAHSETGAMIEVQVKTASFGGHTTFMLGEKGCNPALRVAVGTGDPRSVPGVRSRLRFL